MSKKKPAPVVLDPAFWPDGSQRSQDNCFTTPFGVPTAEWAAKLEEAAKMRERSTKTRAAMLEKGIDHSTIKGLSKNSDLGQDKRARRWMEKAK